jgi:RNA polymerase sigma factor (sigma-70 family)
MNSLVRSLCTITVPNVYVGCTASSMSGPVTHTPAVEDLLQDSKPISDEVLISQLVQGDPYALDSLYQRHRRFLFSLAYQITGDAGGAEEVLQDTFLQLWRKSYQFDSVRGSLIGWLSKISRNGAIDHLRRSEGRFQSESLSDDTEVLSQNIESSFVQQHIARELISAALTRLPKSQQQALTLAYFDGWTCEEIALRTGTPEGTIKARLRSALKTMRRILSNPIAPVTSEHAQLCPTLDSILITEQLLSRDCRPRDPKQEEEYLHTLAEIVSASPERLIDSFLQMPVDLCRAGTSGLSFLETDSGGEQVFRWTNLAGKLAKHVGGATPRNFSPCGVTLDRNSPQLFAYPGRYFHYFNEVEVPIIEGLVIPFRMGENIEGTVWIVSHEDGWRFDSEDARIMTRLAEVVGCALYLARLSGAKGRARDSYSNDSDLHSKFPHEHPVRQAKAV